MPGPAVTPLTQRTRTVVPHRPRGPKTTGSGPGSDPRILRRVAAALRNLPARHPDHGTSRPGIP